MAHCLLNEATDRFALLAVFCEREDFKFLDHQVGLVDGLSIFLEGVLLDGPFYDDLVALSANFTIGDALAHLFWEDGH